MLDDVTPVLERLSPHYRLIVATKGDLLDQESKMSRSGISSFFHHIDPCEFLMIGNSMKSDVLPTLNLGASAIHVPFHTTWAHEEVENDPSTGKFFRVNRLKDVLGLIQVPA